MKLALIGALAFGAMYAGNAAGAWVSASIGPEWSWWILLVLAGVVAIVVKGMKV
jgi:hypothetical protein